VLPALLVRLTVEEMRWLNLEEWAESDCA